MAHGVGDRAEPACLQNAQSDQSNGASSTSIVSVPSNAWLSSEQCISGADLEDDQAADGILSAWASIKQGRTSGRSCLHERVLALVRDNPILLSPLPSERLPVLTGFEDRNLPATPVACLIVV